MSLVTSDQSSVKKREPTSRSKVVFYRLYGDIVESLNEAVTECISQGKSQAAIARDADMDPATLSRILTGQAGTNLRSVACVLAATDHRLKVGVVSCKHLKKEADLRRDQQIFDNMVTLVSSKDGRVWKKPKENNRINSQEKQFSNVLFLDAKDKVSV